MLSTKQAKYNKPKHQVFHGFKFNRRLQEGLFIFTFAISVFLLLSFVTYNSSDPSWSCVGASDKVSNAAGYVGAWLSDVFLCAFGYIAYLFPCLLICAAWMSWRQRFSDTGGKALFLWRTLGFFLILLSGSSLIDLHFSSTTLSFGAGGILGNLLHLGMVNIFNVLGANLILAALFFCGVTFFSGLSWLKLLHLFGCMLLFLAGALGKGVLYLRFPRFKGAKVIDDMFEAERSKFANKRETPVISSNEDDSLLITPFVKNSAAATTAANAAPKQSPPLINMPTQIKTSARAEKEKQLKIVDFEKRTLPPLSLLDPPDKKAANSYTPKQLEEVSRAVELRMKDFGIDTKVVAVHPGPVVTRFELQLAAGTKVSRITTLAKDLARSLSVISVRVVEVIPGKSVIGLELPNVTREVVRLREILSSQQYEHTKAALALALGKDISGHPIIVDLAKMPHLLVAGTTGSGKSVCLNAILLSLLYKYTPRELRLILIDPKMLELSVYDNIAHLLTPVVTNMKEAANALRWCVAEMERRYRLMMHLGVRNIAGFNGKVIEGRNKGKPILDPLWREESGEEQQELGELPYVVVIADEYADMIMVVGKKVEELIARIAQKARAAGIHLLLATQRPSVDVITGLIKANIPARIAFQVSSKIDSRTILDQSGAEQLLGYGDMLYLAPGTGIPVRVHGAFVADDEVHTVIEEIKKYEKPQYLDEITEGNGSGDFTLDGGNGNDEDGAVSDAEQDVLYDQAVKMVTELRKVSVSSVQRRFKIGYNRAARIVEAMELAGVVSPMESNGNRQVLAPPPREH